MYFHNFLLSIQLVQVSLFQSFMNLIIEAYHERLAAGLYSDEKQICCVVTVLCFVVCKLF